MASLMETAGIKSSFGIPPGVEMTMRTSGEKRWVFLLNHTSVGQQVTLPGAFTDASSGATHSGKIELKAYDAVVLQPA